jgi:subtilase family serine protease
MQMPFIYIESAHISASQVEPNSPVHVTATVANKGTVNGSFKIRLYVNGYEEPGLGVTLASGQSRTLTFDVSRSEPGAYQVYVNGTPAGSFEVNDNSSNNAVLIMSTLCLLGALFIGILLALRRRQNQY